HQARGVHLGLPGGGPGRVAGPHRQDRLTAALRIGTPVGRLLSAIGLGPAGGGPRVGTISDPRARSSIRSEQRTHNPLVAGSSPAGPTNDLPGTTPRNGR